MLVDPGDNWHSLGRNKLNQRSNHLKSERFDQEALWNRVHGDLSLLRELVELSAREFPAMLARIEKAIQEASPSDLEKASHKIKGSMLQFSAHAAATLALQLEEKGRNGSIAGVEVLFEKLKQEIAVVQRTLHVMVQGGASH
jgi:HPt (histidine-containing phosphotransfer) domain-containing protein